MSKHFLFVAIVPNSPVYESAWHLKHHCATKYKTIKALNSPPHLTLIPPFHSDNFYEVDQLLTTVAAQHAPFALTLDGFGFFSPKTVFIDTNNQQQLEAIYQDLCNSMNCAPKPYKAHLTIANRDIKPEVYPEMEKEFSEKHFEAKLEVRCISLLEHNGCHWFVKKNYGLKK